MSGYAQEWAIDAAEAKGLGVDATLVLQAVAYFAHPRDGMAWQATRAEIRAKTRLPVVRIIRAVREIEESGVIGMARRRRGIAWGPFPILPRGGVDNSRVPRAHGRAPQHVAASLSRAPMTARLARAHDRAEPPRGESQNLSGADCPRCGGSGVLLGGEVRGDPGRRSIVRCGCES